MDVWNLPTPRRPLGSLKNGVLALGLLLTYCVGGCPGVPTDGGDGQIPLLDEDGNSTFKTATALALQNDETLFRGQIGAAGDVDIYDLGTLSAGDRLYVDVQRTSGDLDAMAAVFDYREYVHAFNDDRTPDASNLNPLIDIVIRGPTGTYYLGIVPLYGGGSTGEYEVSVQITRGVGVPAPEIVADRYDGYGLLLLNSDDHAEPAAAHSTIYFGGYNAEAFAISEKIDTMNADHTDAAIIFTGAYSDAFRRNPSFEQMAAAVGNTVAHEIGHLLGLVHTVDCIGLMDSSCGNSSILVAQSFKLSSLHETVFPEGWQEANELLEWVIGLVGL
jgi:hypothetical protein